MSYNYLMQVLRTIKEMHSYGRSFRSADKSIGLVPTMGALHEGHLSLVRQSISENDVTVVSIFVNPTQFGPSEDFNRYPKDHKSDMEKLSTLNVDAVFMPEVAEMYPKGFSTFIYAGGIGNILCGASRPDHFNGVATIVTKLFNIVMPDRAYFGQKDFQQSVVIKKVVRELGFDIDIVVCPIIREDDGLAMSSRNSYLSDDERKSALILNKALQYGKTLMMSGKEESISSIKDKITSLLTSDPIVRIDYVEIAGPEYLEKIQEVKLPAAICIAVNIGNTRLIDNIIVL